MIDLKNGELIDIMPSQMSQNIQIQCISYALKQTITEVIKKAEATRTNSEVDELPEDILDILAIELRAPYYDQTADIETKRKIIKNVLNWHCMAGTPAAVEEMIAAIFGEGGIVEWWNFTEGDKTPGYFDIITNARLTEDMTEKFLKIIKRVKNERSHLRRVLINRALEEKNRIGNGALSYPEEAVTNDRKDAFSKELHQNALNATIGRPEEAVTNEKSDTMQDAAATKSAVSAAGIPEESITNRVSKENAGESTAEIRTGALSEPEENILNAIVTRVRSPAGDNGIFAAVISEAAISIT